MRTEAEIRTLLATWNEVFEEHREHPETDIARIAVIRINTLMWVLGEYDEKVPQV